jgi:hypothetical protein
VADIDEQPMFGPEDVARAVQHLIDNAYIGELDELDRDDLEEIARIVLTSYRAGQAATPDGPRRWALPDEPGPEVTAVRGRSQTFYRHVGRHWEAGACRGVERWWEILADGPLTDATPAADGQDGDGRG